MSMELGHPRPLDRLVSAILAVLFSATLLAALALSTQIAPSPTALSNREARRIVEAGIAALGGVEGVRSINTFRYTLRGTSWQLFANRDPEEPPEAWEYERVCALDTERNRFFGDVMLRRTGYDYAFHTRTVVDGNQGWEAIVPNRWFLRLEDPSAPDHADCAQFLPHRLLADALRHPAALRSLGRAEIYGRPHEVVTYVAANGRQSTLAFDAASRLPTFYEHLYTRSMVGDASFAVAFRDYEPVGATRVPMRRITYNAGFVSSDVQFVEVELEDPFGGIALEVPEGFVDLETVAAEPEVVRLADGVYVLRNLPGGFHTLFVAFEDHALVVEAPESDAPSGIAAQVVDAVRETLPGLPIRYVVLTHHHGDHASGARTFLAEGATVVTTPGNERFVERLAAAPFTLEPDALARSPRPARIELVEGGHRVLADAGRRVELHDVGPIPHAEEMLVVYLPEEQILFQSDLFNPVTPGGPEPVAYDDPWHGVDVEDTKRLLAFIRERELQVERIVGSHGRVGTLAELEDAAGVPAAVGRVGD